MNPENPQTPREEVEMRLTALLLGELSPEEAAWVRELIARDPELAALYERLGQAVEFLREASVLREPIGHSNVARLSTARREKLLAHFQSTPMVRPPPTRRRNWRSLVPVGLAAALIALIGGSVLLNEFQARQAAGVLAVDRAAATPSPAAWAFPPSNRPVDDGLITATESRSSDREQARPDTPRREIHPLDDGGARIVLPSVSSNETLAQGLEPGQTANNFGIAQVRETDGAYSAWVSQPGSIRTFGNTGSRQSDESGRGFGGALRGDTPAPDLYALDSAQTMKENAPVSGIVAPIIDTVTATSRPAPLAPAARAASPESSRGGSRNGDATRALLFTEAEPAKRSSGAAEAMLRDPATGSERFAEQSGQIRFETSTAATNSSDFQHLPSLADGTGELAERSAQAGQKMPATNSAASSLNGNNTYAGGASVSGRILSLEKEVKLQANLGTVAQRSGAARDDIQPQLKIATDDKSDALETKPAISAPVKFWNEDETGKIKIETAGEQRYRDTSAQEQLAAGSREKTRLGEELAEINSKATTNKQAGIGGGAGQPEDRFYKSVELAKLEESKLKQVDKDQVEDQVLARKPAVAAPEPQPEITTRDNRFSTFSLNVTDVTFKLAHASLEKGNMPDPASVRSEEFINAFDYRDPEPVRGAPLVFAWEQAHYPFAQNRDLLRLSIKTAAAGRQPGRALNLVLLLDNSGSMERADRVRIVREALRVLGLQLQSHDRLSIITFARTPHLWADGVAGDKAAEMTARVSEITPQGGTDIGAALDLAYATARRHYQVGSINRVVLLTDGAANLGDVDPQALKQKVETHRKQGIALDCFGIGWEGFNDDLLEVLSRNADGRYAFINTPEEAATEFAGQLAGALRVAASDVKVQVEFNPQRVTLFRQIGYAKHQLTKEQFRDNSVDAAEIGAAESGNALYIVEVNPRGQGDLGVVRVRFKVPGTTDYREHEWSIPFTASALPLEQASPAIRLAASAGAFAEWLAHSPYAGEVTPDRLIGLLNGVPEIYGADSRPKKLEWMIRQAKSIAGR